VVFFINDPRNWDIKMARMQSFFCQPAFRSEFRVDAAKDGECPEPPEGWNSKRGQRLPDAPARIPFRLRLEPPSLVWHLFCNMIGTTLMRYDHNLGH
jgi:hypothetical protein